MEWKFVLPLLVLAGCTANTHTFHAQGFTADEFTAIKAGADEWSSYGYIAYIDDRKTADDGVILKMPWACDQVTPGGCYINNSREIIMINDNAWTRACFPAPNEWLLFVKTTAMHELGHHFGKHDLDEPGHVMTEYNDPLATHDLTPGDVNQ